MNNNLKLNKNNENEQIHIAGWVKKTRKLGELIFIDLRVCNDIVQIVVDKNHDSFDLVQSLRNEYVIEVKGKVVIRKNINKDLPSGEVEIFASEIKLISKSKQTPLIIDNETDALEQIRMKYRYLDLRRPNIKGIIQNRSKINHIIRNYFYENDFTEIETPIITKPTPGGANELKVLSQNHKDKYYSLVQSPQIYKQLLMYGGVEKYYQIARCFRDEDSRKDRQIEFTQLDIEVAFTNEQQIKTTIEKLLKKLWKDLINVDINIPFESISYNDAINHYGSDKPDTRIENKLFLLTNDLKDTKINFISNAINNSKEVVAVSFEEKLSKSFIKKIEEKVKSEGAEGLISLRIENKKLIDGSIKIFNEDEIKKISEKAGKNSTTLFIIGEKKETLELMGRVRILVAENLNLLDENKFNFLWIEDWPLFLKDEEGKFESSHNPFTSVKESQIKDFMNNKNIESLISRAYDIVLNGNEIGGGSIRFNNFEQQSKAFEIIGLDKKTIENNFGWFLEAMQFGIPYHGGIALGIDRIMAIMLKQNSIRDVIAFPKTTRGTDEMFDSPIEIEK